jgi:hypothetical protein
MLKCLKAIGCVLLVVVAVSGCHSTTDRLAESAGNKNVNISGYAMLGEIEVANPETATPQGRMIVGRVEYQSRKVSVPADQKVPNTGYFKAVKSKSLLGTEEVIIQYDFTAGSDADAKRALEILENKRKEANQLLSTTTNQEGE